jgi:HK97 family phage prohead protease
VSDLMLRAAAARMASGRNLADRPTERRSDQSGGPAAVRASAALSLREPADGGFLHFHGVASVTETPYELWDFFGPYTEVVAANAFDECLNRADLDVPLVLAHDSLRRIARTTNGSLLLTVTDAGLEVDAPELDPTDADVAYIAPKLRAGLIDEMSFAFRIDAGEWSPDWTTFRITKVDIHRGDVAIVGYGANPNTSGELRDTPTPLPSSRLVPWLALATA